MPIASVKSGRHQNKCWIEMCEHGSDDDTPRSQIVRVSHYCSREWNIDGKALEIIFCLSNYEVLYSTFPSPSPTSVTAPVPGKKFPLSCLCIDKYRTFGSDAKQSCVPFPWWTSLNFIFINELRQGLPIKTRSVESILFDKTLGLIKTNPIDNSYPFALFRISLL